MIVAKENFATNPLMVVLRTNYERLYRSIFDNESCLVVPTAASLTGVQISQVFLEAHIIHATHLRKHYLNLIGQGVDIREGCVYTSFGCREHRVCNILQRESFFEFSKSIQVIVIDRPLQGPYEESELTSRLLGKLHLTVDLSSDGVKRLMNGWLKVAPAVEGEINRTLEQFKRTYVLVPGLEHDAAYRIGEICSSLVNKLAKYQHLTRDHIREQQLLQSVCERYIYSLLHPFIWVHLVSSLKSRDVTLRDRFYSPASGRFLIRDTVRSLVPNDIKGVNLDSPAEKIKELQRLLTPMEKLECLHETANLINGSVNDYFLNQGNRAGYSKKQFEVGADEFLPLLLLTVALSRLPHPAAHAAHIDMYLAHKPVESRIQQSSYVFSSYHAALCSVLTPTTSGC